MMSGIQGGSGYAEDLGVLFPLNLGSSDPFSALAFCAINVCWTSRKGSRNRIIMCLVRCRC